MKHYRLLFFLIKDSKFFGSINRIYTLGLGIKKLPVNCSKHRPILHHKYLQWRETPRRMAWTLCHHCCLESPCALIRREFAQKGRKTAVIHHGDFDLFNSTLLSVMSLSNPETAISLTKFKVSIMSPFEIPSRGNGTLQIAPGTFRVTKTCRRGTELGSELRKQ